MAIALIDADIIAFRCAASSENERDGIALFRVDEMMDNMMLNLAITDYHGYLTGKGNFRKAICPDYKANRDGKERPKYLQQCRDHLVSKWRCEVTNGIEADDALGISATANVDSIICSTDKDLKQIPGDHYNFVKNEFVKVGKFAANQTLWEQTLIGDVSDNVKGVYGIGPVKAKKALEKCSTDLERLEVVYDLYEQNDRRLLINLCLLWVQRHEGKIWIHEHPDLIQHFPAELVAEVEQKFSTHMQHISLPSGTMELDGTCQNTISTEVTA